MGVSPSESDG